MGITLLECEGGRLRLPDRRLVLVDRADGGNLVVMPPRPVWERSELSPGELTLFSFLVAAAGAAMLDTLPQLSGGCVNYWEAGNWSLHDDAAPRGKKRAREHRSVHLHLLGRSPDARHPSWRWGEAPKFPDFVDRHEWAAGFARLTPSECAPVVARAEALLSQRYGIDARHVAGGTPCPTCSYPTVGPCEECRST